MGDESKVQTLELPVNYVGLEESSLVFANNMVVQHTEHEFILTFALLHPPIVVTEKDAKKLKGLEAIDAHVSVRVALSPSRIPQLIAILQENFTKFVARHGSEEPAEETS